MDVNSEQIKKSLEYIYKIEFGKKKKNDWVNYLLTLVNEEIDKCLIEFQKRNIEINIEKKVLSQIISIKTYYRVLSYKPEYNPFYDYKIIAEGENDYTHVNKSFIKELVNDFFFLTLIISGNSDILQEIKDSFYRFSAPKYPKELFCEAWEIYKNNKNGIPYKKALFNAKDNYPEYKDYEYNSEEFAKMVDAFRKARKKNKK